jgi:hypothetical protein
MNLARHTILVLLAAGALAACDRRPEPVEAPAAQATQTPQAPPSAATLARTKELEAMAAGG